MDFDRQNRCRNPLLARVELQAARSYPCTALLPAPLTLLLFFFLFLLAAAMHCIGRRSGDAAENYKSTLWHEDASVCVVWLGGEWVRVGSGERGYSVCYWRHEFIDEDINTNGAIEVETTGQRHQKHWKVRASRAQRGGTRSMPINILVLVVATVPAGLRGCILGENNHRFTWNHFAPQNAKEKCKQRPKGKQKLEAGYARICPVDQQTQRRSTVLQMCCDINSKFWPYQGKTNQMWQFWKSFKWFFILICCQYHKGRKSRLRPRRKFKKKNILR